MSEVTTETKVNKIPVISITRKTVQFISFFLINYAILEWIFNTEFQVLDKLLQVLPFLESAKTAWGAGAGLLEYSFAFLSNGQIPYLLIGIIGVFGLFSGRIFCGWVCPSGFMQDLFSGFVSEPKRLSVETDKSMKKIKSVILGFLLLLFFIIYFFFHTDPTTYAEWIANFGSMAHNGLEYASLSEFLFVKTPDMLSNMFSSESSMFGSTWKIILFLVYVVVLISSAYYPRFYCRYLCPYGAAIKIFSKHSFLKLQRLPTRCPGRKKCGVCEQVCPKQIRILDEGFSGFTGDGECNLCLDCVEKCPYDAIKWKVGF